MPTATPAQMAGALRAAGFTGSDVVTGVAVGLAESGGVTNATNANTNGSTDYGTWQINSIHRDALSMGNWANLNDNARMAKLVFDQAGHSWQPWVTFWSGAYKAHLPAAMAAAGNPSTTTPTTPGTPVVPAAQNVSLSGITNFFSFITTSHNWVRLGEYAAGMVLILIGLWQLTGLDFGHVASTAVKTGAKVAAVAA